MSILHRGVRSHLRRFLPSNLAQTVKLLRGDAVVVDWVNRGGVASNWGDRVAPLLVEHLTGLPVVNHRDVLNVRGDSVYTTIGSMLGTVRANRVDVWGTGFISREARLRSRATIHAVRGPRTAEMLEQQGIPCPEIFGDPALFAPRLFSPSDEITYEIGVIPHWKERHVSSVMKLKQMENVRVIDICGKPEDVVQQITSCERIASAALHGMVCADAYGVPTIQINLSDRPAGGGFKFLDYLEGSGRGGMKPVVVDDTVSLGVLRNNDWDIPPVFHLDDFEAACPLPRAG